MADLDHFLFGSQKAPNLDDKVLWPETSWELGCQIGMLISDILYGYEDSFDGVDYADYADDLYRGESCGGDKAKPKQVWTKRQLLEDYAKASGDRKAIRALKDMGA